MTPFKKRNRSAYVNFLRAKLAMYSGALRVDALPYYVAVDPSDACQLRCPTCPTGIENESRRHRGAPLEIYREHRARMTPELFDAILGELGEYVFLMMLYNFGEPLLNRHLEAFIRQASALDIETEVHTNLSLPLSDERVDQLVGSGLDRLEVSADGFTQQAYEVHRVGGDVELVKRNLARLASARDRLGTATRITYKLLVFAHNEHEIDDARRFCDGIGIALSTPDAILHDASWLPSHRRGEQPADPMADPDEVASARARWAAAGREGYFLPSELRPTWGLPRGASAYPAACGWHYGYSVITASGAVSPCCGAAKQVDDFGTVTPGATSFADVWNNDRYATSRAAFAGRSGDGFQHVDTVCLRCYFPKMLHHIYSANDARVAEAFRHHVGASDPALASAYEHLPTSERPDPAAFVEHARRALA